MNNSIFKSLDSSYAMIMALAISVGALKAILTDDQKANFNVELLRLKKESLSLLPPLSAEEQIHFERMLGL